MERPAHSGLGVASFVVGLLALLLPLILAAPRLLLHRGGPGGLAAAAPLSILLTLAGIGLAIPALIDRRHRRLFGALGLASNLLVWGLFAAAVAVALGMKGEH